MNWRLSPRLTAGLAAALIWALAAGSALFWVLRAGGARAPVNAQVAGGPPPGAQAPDARAVARMLGVPDAAAAQAPDVASRLALRGIVTHDGQGAALIAVDGKPARPVRVGAALEGVDGWTLQSVSPRAVVLAAGAQQARLEMPPLSTRSSASDASVVTAPPRPVPAAPRGLLGTAPLASAQAAAAAMGRRPVSP